MRAVRNLLVYVCVATSVLIAGCRKEPAETVNTELVDALYADLLSASRAYADSLKAVSINDTTGQIDRLLSNFENRIWEVNKRYPPELDFHLTQMQNDSLYHYLSICLEIRATHKRPVQTLTPDTVSTDSIPTTEL